MNYPAKLIPTLAAALLLCCPAIFAQNPEEETSGPTVEALFEKAPQLEAQSPRLYRIRNVNIHGVQFINPEMIRSSSGLIPGDSIYLPSNFISEAIARLWSQRYYSDIRVGATIEGDDLDLELFLQERPKVNYWRFEGISKSNQRDLLEQLKLKRGTELSDYVIDKNKKLIRKFFTDKGFRNVEVEARIENDPVLKQAVNVTFVVDRKHKVRIGEIRFTGNDEFSDKRLRQTLKKTHKTSINFLRSTKLNEEDYENDKELLIDFYNSKGFRNATVLSDSIYPINEKRIGIRIDLSEGNKYYIRNVSWVGNSIYETDEL
ncbi:MAG: outer membrane protein assembly factor BamA, partial [Alistipes sp.]|nr:outer membrane protein assembly factor BamA [Alistipes sp.]